MQYLIQCWHKSKTLYDAGDLRRHCAHYGVSVIIWHLLSKVCLYRKLHGVICLVVKLINFQKYLNKKNSSHIYRYVFHVEMNIWNSILDLGFQSFVVSRDIIIMCHFLGVMYDITYNKALCGMVLWVWTVWTWALISYSLMKFAIVNNVAIYLKLVEFDTVITVSAFLSF